MPLEIKHHILPHLKDLDCGMEPATRNGCGSTFTLSKVPISLHKQPSSGEVGSFERSCSWQLFKATFFGSVIFWEKVWIRWKQNFLSKYYFRLHILKMLLLKKNLCRKIIMWIDDNTIIGSNKVSNYLLAYYTGAQNRINALANCNNDEDDRIWNWIV